MAHDQIIEIEGMLVDGTKMDKLETAMDKPAGDRVALVIKRLDGIKSKISVELTASKWE